MNAARFLEETLRSIDAQGDDIEHIVIDGGSSDGTLEIASRFAHVRVLTGRDTGQADALNRGLAEARAPIVAVVNGDDILYPGAARLALGELERRPQVDAVFGDAMHIDTAGAVIGPYPTSDPSPEGFALGCHICQPAAFVRLDAARAIGYDVTLQVAMDYDFWIRFARAYRLARIPGVLAGSRMYRENKTFSQRGAVYRETLRVLKRHFGYVPYGWTYGYTDWLVDRSDQFFTAPKKTPLKVLLSLFVGIAVNLGQPWRAACDWWSHRSLSGRA
jgi:glycosyltransferase involved in cell wall biosynthesis